MALPFALCHEVWRHLSLDQFVQLPATLTNWQEQVYLRGVPRSRLLTSVAECQRVVSYYEAWVRAAEYLPVSTVMILAARQQRQRVLAKLYPSLLSSTTSNLYNYLLMVADEELLTRLLIDLKDVSRGLLVHSMKYGGTTLLTKQRWQILLAQSHHPQNLSLLLGYGYSKGWATEIIAEDRDFVFGVLTGAALPPERLAVDAVMVAIELNLPPAGVTELTKSQRTAIIYRFAVDWLELLHNHSSRNTAVLREAFPEARAYFEAVPPAILRVRAPQMLTFVTTHYRQCQLYDTYCSLLRLFIDKSLVTAAERAQVWKMWPEFYLLAGLAVPPAAESLTFALSKLHGSNLLHKIPERPVILQKLFNLCKLTEPSSDSDGNYDYGRRFAKKSGFIGLLLDAAAYSDSLAELSTDFD